MPKIIGIKFSDNDFHSTITSFLRCIQYEGIECYFDLDKTKLVELFHRSIVGLYWISQNKMNYDRGEDFEVAQERIKEYLQITEEDVFFDSEVKEYILKQGGNLNGEFHVLDTQTREPYIYSA